MYDYRVGIMKVVDGDTVHAVWDFGGETYRLVTLRLEGINAPEMSTPEGHTSRDALTQQIIDHGLSSLDVSTSVGEAFSDKVLWLNMRTHKDKREKYGRYLATLYSQDWQTNINEWMVENEFAVPYDG
jgi:endonuclease YncB( thermonuclease family)